MRFASLFASLKAASRRTGFGPARRPWRQTQRPFAPRLETLEDRTLPSVFTVQNLADAGPGSLRQAVLDANNHPGADLISFSPRLHGTITLTSGELAVTDNVTILGPGADRLTVSGNDASRVFDVAGGTTVSILGLTIAHGRATQGAGIDNAGSLTLAFARVSDNQAVNDAGDGRGGGILNEAGATLAVYFSTLADNRASAHPGPVLSSLPGAKGGGLYNEGDATIDYSAIVGNQAETSGGSFTTGTRGGAVWNGSADAPAGAAASLTVRYSTFADNQAFGDVGDPGTYGGRALGGALFNRFATVTIDGSTFRDNQAVAGASGAGVSGNFGGGGAIANTTAGTLVSTITINRSAFVGNRAAGGVGGAAGIPGGNGDGGAIYNESALTISDSVLAHNLAAGGIGGAGAVAGSFNGSGLGGAVGNFLNAQVTISRSTLDQNRAVGGDADGAGAGGNASGGAVYDESLAAVTLDQDTVAGNSAAAGAGAAGGNGGDAKGGGIRHLGSGTLTITSSAFVDNQALGGAGGDGANGGSALGGGISISTGGTVCINQSCVLENQAVGGAAGTGGQDGQGVGGGVYISGGTVGIMNSVVSGNHASTSDDDVFGTFSDQC